MFAISLLPGPHGGWSGRAPSESMLLAFLQWLPARSVGRPQSRSLAVAGWVPVCRWTKPRRSAKILPGLV